MLAIQGRGFWFKVLTLWGLGAMLCVFQPAEAHDRKTPDDTLLIGGVKFPPFVYVSDKGEIYGAGIDQLNLLFDKLERPYRWLGVAQNRLYLEIQQAHFDLAIATKKESPMDNLLLFTQRPFACLNINLFSAPNKTATNELNNLVNQTVLYYYYFEKEELFNLLQQVPGIKLHSIKNRASAIKMLNAGRADYYLDFEVPFTLTLNEQQTTLTNMRVYQEAAYIVSPSGRSGSADLIETLDELMQSHTFEFELPGIKDTNAYFCGPES